MAAQNGRPNHWRGTSCRRQVSALTATHFAAHATTYQTISAPATGIHELFVDTLGTSAGSYAATEAANAIAVG